jgi:hypothetical protein
MFSQSPCLLPYRGRWPKATKVLMFSVNKTLGAMTGLEFDSVDVLGPVEGRLGMGYFDCFCIPSVGSTPPTPENPNPAQSRHCRSFSRKQFRI